LDDADYALHDQRYETTVSVEHFLSFETKDALLGFLRLSLPTAPPLTPELSEAAMIREVHVYGQSLGLGQVSAGRAQHRGLGRALVARAATLAAEAGYRRLSVISAVGTRVYYRRLGFFDEGLYLHRTLAPDAG
jgi:elongator complex protein 3